MKVFWISWVLCVYIYISDITYWYNIDLNTCYLAVSQSPSFPHNRSACCSFIFTNTSDKTTQAMHSCDLISHMREHSYTHTSIRYTYHDRISSYTPIAGRTWKKSPSNSTIESFNNHSVVCNNDYWLLTYIRPLLPTYTLPIHTQVCLIAGSYLSFHVSVSLVETPRTVVEHSTPASSQRSWWAAVFSPPISEPYNLQHSVVRQPNKPQTSCTLTLRDC